LVCYLFATGLLFNMPKRFGKKLFTGSVVLFFLYYGTMLRHNALPALLPMLFWCVWHFIPSKRVLPIVICGSAIWIIYIAANNVINYHILDSFRTYPLQERYYNDILMLNYFGKHYKNPPDVFGNRFDDLTQELFRNHYVYRDMELPGAFKPVAVQLHRSFVFTMEGIRFEKKNGQWYWSGRNIPYKQFPADYKKLQRSWLEHLTAEPLRYLAVRGYFVLRFFY
jgi:hypothetical protein